MMQQKNLMPAACKECGEFFDLRYDMAEDLEDELENELEIEISWKHINKLLCWDCRP